MHGLQNHISKIKRDEGVDMGKFTRSVTNIKPKIDNTNKGTKKDINKDIMKKITKDLCARMTSNNIKYDK